MLNAWVEMNNTNASQVALPKTKPSKANGKKRTLSNWFFSPELLEGETITDRSLRFDFYAPLLFCLCSIVIVAVVMMYLSSKGVAL